jgi:hypothetical protein
MVFLWIGLAILGWSGCGLLAVGMARHDFAVTVNPKRRHGPGCIEPLLWFVGPIGVAVALIVCWGHYGLKYRYEEDEECGT